MNTKQFRAAVHAELVAWGAANFLSVPIIYENGPVPDEDKIGPIWLDVEIRWYSGEPKSIGQVITARHHGVISTCVYTRETLGTVESDDIIDSLISQLQTRRLGSAIVKSPARMTPVPINGWYKSGLLFPFTLDV